MAGKIHCHAQAATCRVLGLCRTTEGPRDLQQAPLRPHRQPHPIRPPVRAGGRAADPGQVPIEQGGLEGAVQQGPAGRILPGQILGGPEHQ